MGIDYDLYWEGATEADLQAVGYPHLRSLRHVFREAYGDEFIPERYGADVGALADMLNPDPKKHTPHCQEYYIWMETDRLLRAIDSLRNGTRSRDPVLTPLAAIFAEENEGPDWDYLLECLDGLAESIRDAKRLGATLITFDGSSIG